MNPQIASLRQEYAAQVLLEEDAHADPLGQFARWWDQAIQSQIVEPNAMTLATASCDGFPSARIVLLKGFDHRGFVFYTNYQSFKGMQLQENPKACLVFFWKELERQVRVTGLVSKLDALESDAYFLSRPEGSRLGAWASPQSTVVESRAWLDTRYADLVREAKEKVAVRPPHWGGYLVKPVIVEFWQGRPSRLHDRLQYTMEENGGWKLERLAP
ncbi:MAG: pyridoxine 5-phosphate oxidase [Flaviaesturariibacter sp.]|nr:pyridoxine 5-phosphate oxidase [Flaviaesturariibacter sp.]